ncbi:MAG: DNA primase catalytic core [Planctomycetota bacterium]|jgi:DNA primase catalytic core
MSAHPQNSPTDRAAFQASVERIKRATPIEAVVRARVPELKRSGKLHWACCPFHEEKTPSFSVDPGRGTWHCFGACAEGGDSIGFVQRFDGMSFWDALTLLANDCGESLPARGGRERRPEEEERRERLFEVINRAQAHYARILESEAGEAARNYLTERGLSKETAQGFGCGWAPPHGSPLLMVATRAGIPLDLLVEAGLVKLADDGRPYDFFRNRLLIPIRDRLGRSVGFGGRILPGDAARAPKYVNTSETSLFHKGRLIYALDKASDMVRKRRHLVLVEGYTDVMAAHQEGVSNVAAVLGTATTPDHARLVRRSGAERVTLVFDGDVAGGRASERALGELLPLGLKLDVVAPPDGQDPCDLLVGKGGPAFEELLETAQDWFAWSLSGLEGRSGSDLAEGVEGIFALIARLERPVEEALRRKELAAEIGIPEHAVEAQWDRWRQEASGLRREPAVVAGPTQARTTGASEDEPEAPVDPREREAFRLLLGALLSDNSLIPLYSEWIGRAPRGAEHRIFEAILYLYEHGDETEAIDSGSVITALAEDSARDIVVGLEVAASRATSAQALARDQELWLERRDHERELTSLRVNLSKAKSQNTLLDVLPSATPSEPTDQIGATNQTPSGSQSSDDLLRKLHAELKKRRVP